MPLEVMVRNISEADLEEVAALSFRCFGPGMSLKYEHMKSQLEIFPRGQVCAEYAGKIVGCALSLVVNYEAYGDDHTYALISDDGFIRNHHPSGHHLYGIEVGVDPGFRGRNIGRTLYEERKRICKELNLKSIIIGGRMPYYHKYKDQMTPEQYANAVFEGKMYDPVLTFQKQNGFILKKVIPNYLPEDEESLYYAASMEWMNEDYTEV